MKSARSHARESSQTVFTLLPERIGFGNGFQGAVRSVVPLAAPHERAGVLSIVFVVSYLAMGVPAVLAGFLVVHGGGSALFDTAREFGVVVMLLAVLALAGARVAPAR